MDGRLTMTALVIFLAAARADPYVGTDDDGNLQLRSASGQGVFANSVDLLSIMTAMNATIASLQTTVTAQAATIASLQTNTSAQAATATAQAATIASLQANQSTMRVAAAELDELANPPPILADRLHKVITQDTNIIYGHRTWSDLPGYYIDIRPTEGQVHNFWLISLTLRNYMRPSFDPEAVGQHAAQVAGFAKIRLWQNNSNNFLHNSDRLMVATTPDPGGSQSAYQFMNGIGTIFWKIEMNRPCRIQVQGFRSELADNGVSTGGNGGNAELIAIPQGTGGALEFGGLLGGLRMDRSTRLTSSFDGPINPSLMTWTLPTAGTYILFASLRSRREFYQGSGYSLIRLKDRARGCSDCAVGNQGCSQYVECIPNSHRMWSDFDQTTGRPSHMFRAMDYTHSFVWSVNVTSPAVIEIEATSQHRQMYHSNDGNGFDTMNFMKVNPALSASRIVNYNGQYLDFGLASDRNVVALCTRNLRYCPLDSWGDIDKQYYWQLPGAGTYVLYSNLWLRQQLGVKATMRLRFDGGEVVEDSTRTMFEWRKSTRAWYTMDAAITSSWVVTAAAAGRVYIDCMASHYLYGKWEDAYSNDRRFTTTAAEVNAAYSVALTTRSFRQPGGPTRTGSSGVAELIYVKLD